MHFLQIIVACHACSTGIPAALPALVTRVRSRPPLAVPAPASPPAIPVPAAAAAAASRTLLLVTAVFPSAAPVPGVRFPLVFAISVSVPVTVPIPVAVLLTVSLVIIILALLLAALVLALLNSITLAISSLALQRCSLIVRLLLILGWTRKVVLAFAGLLGLLLAHLGSPSVLHLCVLGLGFVV